MTLWKTSQFCVVLVVVGLLEGIGRASWSQQSGEAVGTSKGDWSDMRPPPPTPRAMGKQARELGWVGVGQWASDLGFQKIGVT